MSIVLITKGKHESVDTAEIKIFSYLKPAEEFCAKTSTGMRKYWIKAEIIDEGVEISLNSPEGDY